MWRRAGHPHQLQERQRVLELHPLAGARPREPTSLHLDGPGAPGRLPAAAGGRTAAGIRLTSARRARRTARSVWRRRQEGASRAMANGPTISENREAARIAEGLIPEHHT